MDTQFKHSLITLRLIERLNRWNELARLGVALPELRCTFGGRSIIPDIVYLLMEHIETDASGEPLNEIRRPPDIHVENISPDQAMKKSRNRLAHSIAQGDPPGWLIHPDRKTIEVFRPGQPAGPLTVDGVLEGEQVLPGFRLPVAEVFGWLKLR